MTRGTRIKEAAMHWISANPDRSVLQLCEKLGVSEPTYYNWVRDSLKGMTAENLMKLSLLTGFHPGYLWDGRKPKMLADDKRLRTVLDEIADLQEEDFTDLVEYIKFLRSRKSSQE